MRHLLAVAVAVAIACVVPLPQSASFEVTSVKRNTSLDARTDGALRGERFSMINEPLWRLIGEAYADPQPLPRTRIVGGPDWIDSERFDVEGVAAGPLTREQARLMLRTLLAERFSLNVPADTRPLPVVRVGPARGVCATGP